MQRPMKKLKSGSNQEKLMIPFRAQKIRFLVDFNFVSRYQFWLEATCAELNSFFSSLNTAHSFSTTQKTFSKKASSNPRASEFFLCFMVKLFNIQLWVKTAFHSEKKLLSFHT